LTNSNASLEGLFNSARQSYQAGDFERALSFLYDIQKSAPDIPDVLHFLGLIELRMGKAASAVGHLRKVVTAIPDAPELWVLYGSACKKAELIDEGIAAQQRALALHPGYGDAHFNLGRSFFEQGDLDKAADHLLLAISADPKDLDARVEYSKLLIQKEEIGEAEIQMRQILDIDASHAPANSMLASVVADRGELGIATKYLIRAVNRTPDDPRLFIQVRPILKALIRRIGDGSGLDFSSIDELREKVPATLELDFLAYWLDRFSSDRVNEAYRVICDKLNSTNDKAITLDANVEAGKSEVKFTTPFKDAVALIHWGRSGSGFLHSLVDGHPQISTLPGHYLGDYFGRDTWKDIASTDPDILVERFCSLHEVLFDADASAAPPGFRNSTLTNFGYMEGHTTMGDARDQKLTLDRALFTRTLRELLAGEIKINPNEFFERVHVAFDRCLNRQSQTDLLFYHIHNPDSWALLNYLRYNSHAKLLLSVREPLQSCESWASDETYGEAVTRVQQFLFTFDQVEFKHYDSRGIRLEDLKLDTDKTLKTLCEWMQIEDDDVLRSPTFQGLKYWGDPSSIKFDRKDSVIGFEDDKFDPTSDPIKRKVGYFFSERDQLILRTLLYPVRVAYRYQASHEEQFVRDLETIKPMLDEPLDFERNLADKLPPGKLDLMENASRLCFRSALYDRWETLDAHGTYPNMIKPLFDGQLY